MALYHSVSPRLVDKCHCRRQKDIDKCVLIEGIHYIRPFGGRKILYIWDAIQKDMVKFSKNTMAIPMSNGGVVNG